MVFLGKLNNGGVVVKPISIEVVSALPEFFTVYDLDESKEIVIGDPIIAWRIETYPGNENVGLYSITTALTIDGDAISNCIGVRNPDMTITIFEDATYSSLEKAQNSRYPTDKNAVA